MTTVSVKTWKTLPADIRPAGFGGDEDFVIEPDDMENAYTVDIAERIADRLTVCNWEWQRTRESVPRDVIVTCHA